MMSIKLNLLYFILFATSALGEANILIPCKKGDQTCVNKSAQAAWPLLLEGNSDLGMESSDPLKVSRVDANLANLKYSFEDATLDGLKSCAINNVTLELEKLKMHVDFYCTKLVLSGQYEIKGQILVLPIEGKGPFTIEARAWDIHGDFDLKIVEDADKNKYLNIKSFKLEHDIQEYAYFDLQNLFNGQKELAETVLKFLNDNWHDVAKEISSPGLYGCAKKVVKNFNKYLKSVPIEKLFLE